MKATTIKIEGELLERLERAKPASKSISAYVRDVLEGDLRRRKVAEAAVEYRAFTEAHPGEDAWMAEWDRADLAAAPRKKQGKS